MSDVRVHYGFPGHFKTKKLIAELGYDGVFSLIQLWTWVAEYRPKGKLTGMSEQDIAYCAGWVNSLGESDREESIAFINHLIACGFLDKGRGRGYVIHDWEDWNAYAYYAPERREAAKKGAQAKWTKTQILDAHPQTLHREQPITPDLSGHSKSANGLRSAPSPLPSPTPTPIPAPSPSPSPPPIGKEEKEEGEGESISKDPSKVTPAVAAAPLADAGGAARREDDGIDPSLRGEFWQALERKWREKGLSFPTPGCPVSNDRLWREGVVAGDGIEEVPFAGRVIRSELTVAQRSRVHPRQWGWNRWIVEQPREFFATAVERDRLAEKVPLGLSPDEIKTWLRKHFGVGCESEAAS